MNPLKAHYLLGEGGYQGDINGPIPFWHKHLLGHESYLRCWSFNKTWASKPMWAKAN
jgi:hypothetical protein